MLKLKVKGEVRVQVAGEGELEAQNEVQHLC